jgi:hypothetical protein
MRDSFNAVYPLDVGDYKMEQNTKSLVVVYPLDVGD